MSETSNKMPLVEEAIGDVKAEVLRATAKHKPFNSRHEGFAVLQEEVDELWQEVKYGTSERAEEEAIQVAAKAVRFLVDCCA